MERRVTRSRGGPKASNQTPEISESKEPQQLSSPPATPSAEKNTLRKARGARTNIPSKKVKIEEHSEPTTPKSVNKRGNRSINKIDDDPDELPHNLGKGYGALETPVKNDQTPVKKKARPSVKKSQSALDDPQNQIIAKNLVAQSANAGVAQSSLPEVSPKKGKKASKYGHTPGITPFPDYAHPTPEECQEVTRLLSSVHGKIEAPKEISKVSLTVSGCGEVPHVLDALVRTRLSANTSGNNSNRAFQGLVKKFGTVKDSFDRESVDWNAVRLASQKDVFEAIKSGGLADRKSKDIKAILDMVYEENQARRKALLSTDQTAPGEENEADEEKDAEITRAEEDILSLDHIHLLSNEESFEKLISYPGIGAKTASCVMLFCLQRPSFAVDTHVWRLCKWLGWVPSAATRDETFSHCEVRVPDNLKYPLHQLLIRHGKACPRCRAITGENSAGWDEGCVIEELVTRTGTRKGAKPDDPSPKKKPKGKGAKKRKRKLESEDEEEDSELSDLAPDEE